ncbi:hypothetical protein B0T44_00755 [Nocardia donostiensis]|uniref:Protein-glutamine gamma-glutamyltransferase-like C-terminal domain-containing protein n=1 Tax=Nocardia donostiensis TaxID=1538463 RepID=A0A1W0BPC5_9NOCA|nr:hypothetical protein B0T46_17280 [Nocardia donostiensis]OQS24349.1 hypothetical protein B0T44_00755 [Nocardia donostiensis]
MITLLVCAVVALRGEIPGASGPADGPSAPSALMVALMPVLLTVSVVILLAGVIASQHRLPLAMPEPDPDTERQQWRLSRTGLLVLFGIAVVSVLIAAASALYFAGLQPREAAEVPDTPDTSAPTTTTEPPGTPRPAPDDETAELTGTALVLTFTAAITLVGVAVAGLVVVAIHTRRAARPQAPEPVEPAGPSEADSLVKAAEMGLAAMNAPGQDPREAIIACYIAMERGLSTARAAAPLVSDTPMEVLARAFEHGALHDASARELVALFEEARFSPHSMLEWQRMRAEQLLRIVLADLQRQEVPA